MISRRELIRNAGYLTIGAATPTVFHAQSPSEFSYSWNRELAAKFVARAEALKPVLHEVTQPALNLVKPEADASRYLRWKMVPDGQPESLRSRSFRAGDSFVVDFGGHRTGYLPSL